MREPWGSVTVALTLGKRNVDITEWIACVDQRECGHINSSDTTRKVVAYCNLGCTGINVTPTRCKMATDDYINEVLRVEIYRVCRATSDLT